MGLQEVCPLRRCAWCFFDKVAGHIIICDSSPGWAMLPGMPCWQAKHMFGSVRLLNSQIPLFALFGFPDILIDWQQLQWSCAMSGTQHYLTVWPAVLKSIKAVLVVDMYRAPCCTLQEPIRRHYCLYMLFKINDNSDCCITCVNAAKPEASCCLCLGGHSKSGYSSARWSLCWAEGLWWIKIYCKAVGHPIKNTCVVQISFFCGAHQMQHWHLIQWSTCTCITRQMWNRPGKVAKSWRLPSCVR